MASEGSFLNGFCGQYVLTIHHEPETGYALVETRRKESGPTAETARPSCAVTRVTTAVRQRTLCRDRAGGRGIPDPDSGEGRGPTPCLWGLHEDPNQE